MAEYTQEELLKRLQGKIVGCIDRIGIRVTKADPSGFCEVELDIEERHLNPLGTVHGGVVFTVADTVGGFAVNAMGEAYCTTCTSTIDFMSPTLGIKTLVGQGRVIKHGRRMSTVEVKIFDEKGVQAGQLLARYYHLDENLKAK